MPKDSYEFGQYASGACGGKHAGMWFIKRTREEVVAYAEDRSQAWAIIRAFEAEAKQADVSA